MTASEAPPEEDASAGALRSRARRALGWSMLSTIGARVGTMAIGIVLARVLGPEEFGTFAVATVALLAMLSFNELGVSLAVVRWPDDPRRIVPTVATLAAGSSLLVFAGVQVAAPYFAAAMGDPSATGAVRVLALNILVNGLASTSAAMLQREFMQGRKTIADQVDNWLGALVSLALALTGWGAMSLAVGRVSGSLAGGALLVAFSPLRLRFGFDREVARRLLRFGLPLAGASMVVFAAGYADQLVVGAVLGQHALGLYVLAVNLSGWPVAVFSQPVRSVAPAAFARLQHDRPALNRAFLATAGLLVGLTLPVCLLLSGSAPALITFVYGPEWAAAAVALAGLGALAGLRIFFELIYDYLVVLERSRTVLAVQALWLAALVPVMLAATHAYGLRGAAGSVVLVALVVVLPVYLWQLRRSEVDVPALLRRIAPGVLSALAVAAVAVAATAWIAPGPLALAVAGAAGLAAAGLYGYRNRSMLREVKGDA
ncbi:PST family polysaccharide transporter [Thermocatellispora tengchongensis]|uniref:PST family polysaccharide transporter n=1 Tax=Thermocatellispora tengchongensis TaxID=1073253 RepID=A0A840PLX0_9ACTN|nr:oligosaccharide flippase family protein [Thermocatellispora tengchongensis]MBB5139906.1 PST family polysaccharide transporter [Thermocatellispora tengchongensis]